MSASQNTQSTQDTAATSSDVFKPGENYCKYWWKAGQIHSKASPPYELATEIPYDTCVELQEIVAATIGARSTNAAILYFGSTSTRTPRTGKEAGASWRPVAKPHVNAAPPVQWLLPGRTHDGIAIEVVQLAQGGTPSVMTVRNDKIRFLLNFSDCYYILNRLGIIYNNQTAIGTFNPTMYEFGPIYHNGVAINMQPGQCVININWHAFIMGFQYSEQASSLRIC
ncbi:hypothetical protein C1646_759091 [Rhizophagus diaphanus]|nr:hypothetical protein C1646_759091 [Rhizophagus diaphanus] [Rhizophagus sp. MUCL 43196]